MKPEDVSGRTWYRVCQDRSKLELSDLGFTFGAAILDQREAKILVAKNDVKFAFRATGRYALSRYGDGTWPVLYTAAEVDTAIHEVAYHARKQWQSDWDGVTPEFVSPTLVYVLKMEDADYEVVPFSDDVVHPIDYSKCHGIAAEARRRGVAGLVAPSARKSGGLCLPVFVAKVLLLHVGREETFAILWKVAENRLLHDAQGDWREVNIWRA